MDERRRAPRGAVRALDEKLARRTLMGASVQRSLGEMSAEGYDGGSVGGRAGERGDGRDNGNEASSERGEVGICVAWAANVFSFAIPRTSFKLRLD